MHGARGGSRATSWDHAVGQKHASANLAVQFQPRCEPRTIAVPEGDTRPEGGKRQLPRGASQLDSSNRVDNAARMHSSSEAVVASIGRGEREESGAFHEERSLLRIENREAFVDLDLEGAALDLAVGSPSGGTTRPDRRGCRRCAGSSRREARRLERERIGHPPLGRSMRWRVRSWRR